MVSGLFLFGYVTVLLPVVLYTGSLALITMFGLNMPLYIVVAIIGGFGVVPMKFFWWIKIFLQ
ncbi:MAG: hypothetical protein CM1200mP10_07210 [Candidatus Neomarinimicrobiota bacterium]|nr:MAG: hypothetical protein CM1200mP10_07210 [Candidatus Neomarinimicrobiota bacterium]